MDIVTVTNETISEVLGDPLSTFGLLYALFPNGFLTWIYGSPVDTKTYVFDDACKQADGSSNCTATCLGDGTTAFGSQYNGSMFQNLPTLHNCIVYPSIADQYEKNNLTQEARATADDLKIQAAAANSSVTQPITRQIQTCLIDYCTSVPGCANSYTIDPTSDFDSSNSSVSPYDPKVAFDLSTGGATLVSRICQYLPSPVNSDIGGIGIYISYWIQAGLALLGFLATVLYDSWLYYGCLGLLAVPHGYQKAREKAQNIHFGNKQHLSRLTVALIDFQKAQSFFMCAINIAAIVVLYKGGLEPHSIQQVYETYVFIKIIAVGGYLPITFTLFTLHLVDMVSWYLITLSCLSVGLSIGTLTKIGDFTPSENNLDDISSYGSSGGPSSCGTWRPGAYCYFPTTDPTYVDHKAFGMLGFCLVVLFLLIVKQSKVLKKQPAQRAFSWLSIKLRGPGNGLASGVATVIRPIVSHTSLSKHPSFSRYSNTSSQDPASLRAGSLELLVKAFVAAVHLMFTGLYIYWFWFFCKQLRQFAEPGYLLSTTWNFGQIVAITVWAQPLCEYIHLEFRGMKGGMEHRIVPPYKLIKDEEIRVVGAGSEDSTTVEDYPLDQGKGAYEKVQPIGEYTGVQHRSAAGLVEDPEVRQAQQRGEANGWRK